VVTICTGAAGEAHAWRVPSGTALARRVTERRGRPRRHLSSTARRPCSRAPTRGGRRRDHVTRRRGRDDDRRFWDVQRRGRIRTPWQPDGSAVFLPSTRRAPRARMRASTPPVLAPNRQRPDAPPGSSNEGRVKRRTRREVGGWGRCRPAAGRDLRPGAGGQAGRTTIYSSGESTVQIHAPARQWAFFFWVGGASRLPEGALGGAPAASPWAAAAGLRATRSGS